MTHRCNKKTLKKTPRLWAARGACASAAATEISLISLFLTKMAIGQFYWNTLKDSSSLRIAQVKHSLGITGLNPVLLSVGGEDWLLFVYDRIIARSRKHIFKFLRFSEYLVATDDHTKLKYLLQILICLIMMD